MGKMGKLLREQKKKTATYTFTAEQLEAHDKAVIQEREAYLRDRIRPTVEALVTEEREKAHQVIQEEWDIRARDFQLGEKGENYETLLSYLLAIPSRVLIERFHWKPIPQDGKYDKRNRTMRFADCLVDELSKISHDDMMDIRKYCDETYRLYGVKFTAEEVPET